MAQIRLDNLPGVVLEVTYDEAAQWLSIDATRETDGTEHVSAGMRVETIK